MLHASVEPLTIRDSTSAAAVAKSLCMISLEFALERRQNVGVGDLSER